MDITYILAIIVGGIGIFLYWALVLRRKKSNKKDLVLFVGPCGGGKTTLAYRMYCGKVVPTVTSMRPHVLDIKGEGKSSGTVAVVDFPGHPRLRSQLASDYLRRAKKVVFVIDSFHDSSKLREAAEFLYDMFTDASFDNNGPPVFVACNKSDIAGALPVFRTKLRLQEEIDKIRKTRQSVSESNETGSRLILGREGQPFNIDRDAPVEVAFESVSALTGAKLDELMRFIELA